jgi:hypothetical protein
MNQQKPINTAYKIFEKFIYRAPIVFSIPNMYENEATNNKDAAHKMKFRKKPGS